MRWFRAFAGAILLFGLCVGSVAWAMPSGSDGQAVREASQALSEVRVEDAARLLGPVLERHPNDPDVLETQAMLHFHRGEYEQAVAALDRAIAHDPSSGATTDRRALRELIDDTRAAVDGFDSVRSPDGRFVVRYAPGPDAILAPYALDAMAAADRALQEELGVRVPGPIRLEIYPTPRSLAEVSTLSVEEIERTGTIALCKWDRLMITSPRALVRGYPWLDTIAHEYVHLVLSRASNDRAPVWFQEGVAKFLERRWRGEPPRAHVDPAVAGILDEAVKNDELIPFEQLHPSIARLPSQKDAALAFAQVATFIESFYDRYGAEGLRQAIAKMAQGTDAREALAEVAAQDWDRLESRWRTALRARPSTADEAPRMMRMRFRHGDGEVDDASEVEEDRARRFLRLGDLLFDRGRTAAAAIEYGKAHDEAPDDPIVASRFGRAAVESGQAGQAIEALERMQDRYPDHAPTHAVLGRALLQEGRVDEAREVLREAIRINPFDPAPHCDLERAAENDDERRREAEACRVLGGSRGR